MKLIHHHMYYVCALDVTLNVLQLHVHVQAIISTRHKLHTVEGQYLHCKCLHLCIPWTQYFQWWSLEAVCRKTRRNCNMYLQLHNQVHPKVGHFYTTSEWYQLSLPCVTEVVSPYICRDLYSCIHTRAVADLGGCSRSITKGGSKANVQTAKYMYGIEWLFTCSSTLDIVFSIFLS